MFISGDHIQYALVVAAASFFCLHPQAKKSEDLNFATCMLDPRLQLKMEGQSDTDNVPKGHPAAGSAVDGMFCISISLSFSLMCACVSFSFVCLHLFVVLLNPMRYVMTDTDTDIGELIVAKRIQDALAPAAAAFFRICPYRLLHPDYDLATCLLNEIMLELVAMSLYHDWTLLCKNKDGKIDKRLYVPEAGYCLPRERQLGTNLEYSRRTVLACPRLRERIEFHWFKEGLYCSPEFLAKITFANNVPFSNVFIAPLLSIISDYCN